MYGLHIVVVNCVEAKPAKKIVVKNLVRIMMEYEIKENVISTRTKKIRVAVFKERLVALSGRTASKDMHAVYDVIRDLQPLSLANETNCNRI
jgi:hypothetical protein